MTNKTTMFIFPEARWENKTHVFVLLSFLVVFVDKSNLDQSNHHEFSALFHPCQLVQVMEEEAAKSMAAAEAEDLRGRRYVSIGG